jgi:hypothetical protein
MVRKNMTDNANPLRRFFRQPAIYIKLPSDGNFYPNGVVNMPPNRELPVYPMTAMDEITYRTADALFNGSAVVNVIQSCIPNIRDPWKIPSIDMDTLLVAIRIASAGHELQFDSVCPHCQNENSFGLDLRTVLEGLRMPDYSESVVTGDLEIYFRPLSYEETNENSVLQFEDQKMLEMLPDSGLSETEKIKRINQAFVKLSEMTMNAIAQSISMIRMGNDMVVEPEFIQEFVKNCSRDVFQKIRDHIVSLKDQSELKPIKITCQNHECTKQYDTPFTLDVANFFVSAS